MYNVYEEGRDLMSSECLADTFLLLWIAETSEGETQSGNIESESGTIQSESRTGLDDKS